MRSIQTLLRIEPEGEHFVLVVHRLYDTEEGLQDSIEVLDTFDTEEAAQQALNAIRR